MRIPLDYYRILGVPTTASPEQLAQAYQDRSKQLPRKEYSSQAISARRQLLDEAHQILSDSVSKAEYDKNFLMIISHQDEAAPEEEIEKKTSVVEVVESSWQNLPYLEIPAEQTTGALLILQELAEYEQVIQIGTTVIQNSPDLANQHQTDTCLSIALAELELSREQWQQKNYNQASEHGQRGLDLLKKHQVLPSLQTEIEAELAKLVPYRLLNTFTKTDLQPEERKQGIELLQKVLSIRQGIEGEVNDHSGLNVENFLLFIQQLRPLLTSQEQQKIFSVEAKRPSFVALYLFVYTLIAQGFCQKQPILVNEAYQKLDTIATQRQDIIVEKSICALLLGKTELAVEKIKTCSDQQVLQLIRQHSPKTEDLLPGLCWYAEYWLKFEVVPHFKDLLDYPVSLNEYFKDKTVQKYIEELGDEPSKTTFSVPKTSPAEEATMLTQKKQTNQSSQTKTTRTTGTRREDPNRSKKGYTANKPKSSVSNMDYSPTSEIANRTTTQRRRRRKKVVVQPMRLLLSLAIIGLGLGALIYAWQNLHHLLQKDTNISGLEGEQLSLKLAEPPIKQPEIAPESESTQEPKAQTQLNPESAKMTLQEWLKIKGEALGKNHQIDTLNGILTQPVLETWLARAKDLQAQGDYWTFEHQIEVKSLKMPSEVQAEVIARVKEKASYHQKDKINASKSYQDDLVFRYELKKEGERWLISNTSIVK